MCAGLSRSVVSSSLQPCGLQPTRLLCPWDSPGKNTRLLCPPSGGLLDPGIQLASPATPELQMYPLRLSHRGNLIDVTHMSQSSLESLIICKSVNGSPGQRFEMCCLARPHSLL